MKRTSVPAVDEILGHEYPCLDHGFVRLIDYMGNDASIVQAARVSYGKGTKKVHEDRGLIRYLLRNQHSSPLEMVELKFHCKMPIFVARQWVRHRTASINEYSLRYSKAIDQFYLPEKSHVSIQSESNMQGRSAEALPPEIQEKIRDIMESDTRKSWENYENLQETGLARELARINLPVSIYTEWYWKIDLRNLLHFLELRLDAHAQHEIQVYGKVIAEIVKKIVPLTWEAFEDYVLQAETFSRLELATLQDGLQKLSGDLNWITENDKFKQLSKGEQQGFLEKITLRQTNG
ncbi:FAD-dependent thymidylate synthase [bacterium]|nr:FAD-dependent thymidylate synthase [bacterium]